MLNIYFIIYQRQKKEIDSFTTNLLRKPSTANIPENKNKTKLQLQVISPKEQNMNVNAINNNINNILNKKYKSDINIKIANEKDSKEINDSLSLNNFTNMKIPSINKDLLNNTNNNFYNIYNNSNIKFVNVCNDGKLKNEEKFHNKIISLDKNKLLIPNPSFPNKNKFQQLYRNYKDKDKSSKELRVIGNIVS